MSPYGLPTTSTTITTYRLAWAQQAQVMVANWLNNCVNTCIRIHTHGSQFLRVNDPVNAQSAIHTSHLYLLLPGNYHPTIRYDMTTKVIHNFTNPPNSYPRSSIDRESVNWNSPNKELMIDVKLIIDKSLSGIYNYDQMEQTKKERERDRAPKNDREIAKELDRVI